MKMPVILVCACQRARVYPESSRDALCKELTSAGIDYQVVPDLCESVGRCDSHLAEWAKTGRFVVACHARAVKWLFEAAGVTLSPRVALNDFRSESVETIFARLRVLEQEPQGEMLNRENSSSPAPVLANKSTPAPDWTGWFPVLDFDRCVQCMQCLSFCLFGVYGVDDQQRVQVVHPDQCKPGCPACARVCPQGAILFPKHASAGISGGVEEPGREAMPKVDISALLGGDVHGLLRNRSARVRARFGKDRSPLEALEERRRHLMQHGLNAEDIPADVLMNLPSPEEIAVKAKEAAARAQAAIEARRKE